MNADRIVGVDLDAPLRIVALHQVQREYLPASARTSEMQPLQSLPRSSRYQTPGSNASRGILVAPQLLVALESRCPPKTTKPISRAFKETSLFTCSRHHGALSASPV